MSATPTPNPSTQPIRYNLGCKNGGRTVQLCTDLNFNIQECDDSKNIYRYNTVLCDCDNTSYISKADNNTKQYKGRYCEFSDNITCNGNGKVNYTGQCVCNTNFFGNQCQFSRLANCNGRGTPVLNADGTVFLRCENCVNSAGDKCQYTRENTCYGHGTVSVDSSGNPICTCDEGWGGGMCKYNNSRCNNNGTIRKNEDACDCYDGFTTVNMQTEWIDRGYSTPTPRPTGHCNDCASGRGPWKPGDPNSCKMTWITGRSRLTKHCYHEFGVGGVINCENDPRINPPDGPLSRGRKNQSLSDIKTFITGRNAYPSQEELKNIGDRPRANLAEDCDTSWNGACRCASGRNMQRCAVTGYFKEDEEEEACHNRWRGRPSEGAYECNWGSSS